MTSSARTNNLPSPIDQMVRAKFGLPAEPDYAANIPADKLGAIRSWVRQATQRGYSAVQLDPMLKQQYGVGVKQIMAVGPDDIARAGLQGASLGFSDEIGGAVKALSGGSYAQSRDAIRRNQGEFANAHPYVNAATQMAGGALPALAAAPFTGGASAGVLGTALRGAATAGTLGAVQGLGNSTVTTAGGMAADAALSGAVSAAAGGLLSGAGKIAANKFASTKVVGRAATEVLPLDPQAAVGALARQESLAPGTNVLADASPGLRGLLTEIASDPQTGQQARQVAAKNVQALEQAQSQVGKGFDVLKGQAEPVDQPLRLVLKEFFPKAVRPGKQDIDLGKLQQMRSTLLKQARTSSDGATRFAKNEAADVIGQWIESKVPGIQQVSSDYRFITGRLAQADETQDVIEKSVSRFAKNRATGSGGPSIPHSRTQTVGTVLHYATQPSTSARAKAIYSLLLTPQRDATGFQRLVALRDVLANPPSVNGVGSALFNGSVVPQGVNSVVAPNP